MSIKKDHIAGNSVSDTPRDWERYAQVLREHGVKRPAGTFEERLESEWDARLADRARARVRQRVLAPLATLAVAALGFLIVSDTALRNAAANVPVAEDPVLPLLPDAPPIRFAAPVIPPVWIDTNLPLIEPSFLPGMADPSVLGSWADSILHRETPVAGE